MFKNQCQWILLCDHDVISVYEQGGTTLRLYHCDVSIFDPEGQVSMFASNLRAYPLFINKFVFLYLLCMYVGGCV